MLSNTADRNPSPREVCQDAAGSFSTGIIEAQVIRASRNTLPLNASGSSDHSGLRAGTQARIAIQTAAPMKGKLSERCGNFMLTVTLAAIAAARIAATMPTRTQSTCMLAAASLTTGEQRSSCKTAGITHTTSATLAAMKASSTSTGLTPSIHIIVVVVSPTTLPEPPALEAATIAAR